MDIKWNDKISIDHGVLDEEHKVFIDLANKFIHQDKRFSDLKQARKFLADLKGHLLLHFKNEEDYQREIDYSNMVAHHEQHQSMLFFLDDIINKVDNYKNDQLHVIDKLTTKLLTDFLVKHMLEEDMKMRDFAKKLEQQPREQQEVAEVIYV
jgi:hemerythrin